MTKEICIGIDLGTTYSCVAYYESEGKVNVIVNDSGDRITPSYVAFNGEERLIGGVAKKNSGQNPQNTIFDIKRLMGLKFNDLHLQADLKHLTYCVVSSDSVIASDDATNPLQQIIEPIIEPNLPMVEVDYMNQRKRFHPEQISAMILEKLKNDAMVALGCEIKKAVITVPAYFNDSQRQATKDAGRIAGLDVIRIINEPTAAALAYGLNVHAERNVMVYDLGGGTLDVTILTMDHGVFQVRSTSGDTHLGGEDFDNRLKDYCFMLFCDKHILKTRLSAEEKKILFGLMNVRSLANIQSYGADKIKSMIKNNTDAEQTIVNYLEQLIEVNQLYANPRLMRRLKTACEEAKKILSTASNTDVTYDNFYQGIDLMISVSRAKFESMCINEFKRSIEPVESALKGAKMSSHQIDDVVLVGGTTRIPQIQILLNEIFPDKIRCTINPDEAVACGAAINAAIIGDSGDHVTDSLVLIDVTPLTLGIEVAGGVMEPMILRNTQIPAEVEQTFSTHTDNQPTVTIKVYEGERSLTKHNNLLGKFELTDLPMMTKGKPRIKVTFTVDTNGILNVGAKELSSGIENTVIIKNEKGRLNESDIQRMVAEAEQYADTDTKIKETIVARNNLENYMARVQKLITTDDFKNNTTVEQMTQIDEILSQTVEWFNDTDTLHTASDYLAMIDRLSEFKV